jgi:integrase
MIGVNEDMNDIYDRKDYKKRGNPFKRGTTWNYIYYVTDERTGKKKQKYKSGYKTKKEAEIALAETNAKIFTGNYVEDRNYTLKQYLEKWYKEFCLPRLAQNTLNGYRNNINLHIVPELGNKKLTEIKSSDIRYLYNKLSEKLSPKSIQYVHRVLSKAFKDAINDDLILKNPCNGVSRPKLKKFNSGVYDIAQLKALMQVIKNTDYELPILFSAMLGLRRGEALGLRFSDINFDKSTACIRQQVTRIADPNDKNKSIWGIKELKTEDSNRTIYVPDLVLDLIRKQQEKVESNQLKYSESYNNLSLICCRENGSFINPDTLDDMFKVLIKKASLPDIRFHDLRHSFATNLVELDIPLKVISNALGHSSVGITADIYCDVLKKKKQVADVMQNAFVS